MGRMSKSLVVPTVSRLTTATQFFYQYSKDQQNNLYLSYNEVTFNPQNEIKLCYTKSDIGIPIVLHHVSQVYVRNKSTGIENIFL